MLIGLAAIVVGACKPYDNGPPIRSDGAGYHIWTYAILKGDVSFSWYEGDPVDVALHQPDPAIRRFASKYPPGVALIRLPLMVLVVDPARNGLPYSIAEHWVCLFVSVIALVATAAFCLDTCYRLGVSPLWANLSVSLSTFGTGLFHYGTYDASYSHVYSAALFAALVWVAVRAVSYQRLLPFIPVVVLVAGLFLVRTTNILLVGFWVLACWMWASGTAYQSPGFRIRALGAASVGLLIGIGVTLALNFAMFGKLTFNTYPGEGFVWHDPKTLSVLIDGEYGVFPVYPVLGITVVAGLLAGRSRHATAGLVVLLAAYGLLYGYWWEWRLSRGFGHRGFIEIVPFAVPVLALALSSIPRLVAYAVVLLSGAAMTYTLVQMWQYWHNRPYISLAELIAAGMS